MIEKWVMYIKWKMTKTKTGLTISASFSNFQGWEEEVLQVDYLLSSCKTLINCKYIYSTSNINQCDIIYFFLKHLHFLQACNITHFWRNWTTKSISQEWPEDWKQLYIEDLKYGKANANNHLGNIGNKIALRGSQLSSEDHALYI